MKREFVVAAAGERLDKIIAAQFADLSRARDAHNRAGRSGIDQDRNRIAVQRTGRLEVPDPAPRKLDLPETRLSQKSRKRHKHE